MPRTPRTPSTPSTILGRYRLVELLATGGTARVWRAVDEQLDRPVAVKLLHPHLLPDEVSRLRLAAEARAAASLAHPGIGAVYDVDTDAAHPALVMELIDGEPLSERLKRDGPMPPREAARLAAEVADALYHAHRRGVVHRDVKPGNILVEAGSGRARLIDFGIAHSLAPDAASLTQTGTAPGTPRYMAPEQLAGEPVGPRADLWSLGAVLYECLTGRPPHEGATILALARAQLAGPPSTDGLDPALAALVVACLSPDVDDRPLHAGAMAAALRAWLDGDAAPALAGARAAQGRERRGQRTTTVAVAVPREDVEPRRATVPLAGLVAGLLLAAGAVMATVAPWDARAPVATAPSQAATPLPTPDWVTPLREAYAQACGESMPVAQLASLDPDAAQARVDALIDECRKPEHREGNDGNRGRGNGDGENGNGGGNGNDRGGGNGGRGGGPGRGGG
jgi:serine/threonine-protein kinase